MSEFGKGYAYCLGLFIAHAHNRMDSNGLWFYSATDHLRELQIPSALPQHKQDRIKAFVDRCFRLRWDVRETHDHIDSAIKEALDLLLEWDEFLNIPSEKGDYE